MSLVHLMMSLASHNGTATTLMSPLETASLAEFDPTDANFVPQIFKAMVIQDAMTTSTVLVSSFLPKLCMPNTFPHYQKCGIKFKASEMPPGSYAATDFFGTYTHYVWQLLVKYLGVSPLKSETQKFTAKLQPVLGLFHSVLIHLLTLLRSASPEYADSFFVPARKAILGRLYEVRVLDLAEYANSELDPMGIISHFMTAEANIDGGDVPLPRDPEWLCDPDPTDVVPSLESLRLLMKPIFVGDKYVAKHPETAPLLKGVKDAGTADQIMKTYKLLEYLASVGVLAVIGNGLFDDTPPLSIGSDAGQEQPPPQPAPRARAPKQPKHAPQQQQQPPEYYEQQYPPPQRKGPKAQQQHQQYQAAGINWM